MLVDKLSLKYTTMTILKDRLGLLYLHVSAYINSSEGMHVSKNSSAEYRRSHPP